MMQSVEKRQPGFSLNCCANHLPRDRLRLRQPSKSRFASDLGDWFSAVWRSPASIFTRSQRRCRLCVSGGFLVRSLVFPATISGFMQLAAFTFTSSFTSPAVKFAENAVGPESSFPDILTGEERRGMNPGSFAESWRAHPRSDCSHPRVLSH